MIGRRGLLLPASRFWHETLQISVVDRKQWGNILYIPGSQAYGHRIVQLSKVRPILWLQIRADATTIAVATVISAGSGLCTSCIACRIMLAQPLVLGWTFDNGAIMVPVPKTQLLVGCEVCKMLRTGNIVFFNVFGVFQYVILTLFTVLCSICDSVLRKV